MTHTERSIINNNVTTVLYYSKTASYRNATEIKSAVNVSRYLVKKCGVPADKIIVLFLYEAQRAAIDKKMGSMVI